MTASRDGPEREWTPSPVVRLTPHTYECSDGVVPDELTSVVRPPTCECMRPVPSSEAMDACCAATVRRQQRYVLQLVLAVNATMFCVEFGAGLIARSTALLGDSLDMLGDTLVYAFSLYVLNKDRAWRARSALIKGGVMLAFGVGVFVTAIVRLQAGGIPLVPAMMGIGALALVANAFCFALLWRHRTSDLNLRSTWLCSRNDLVANGAVIVAAMLVAQLHSVWPDVLIGVGIAGLFVWTALGVLHDAVPELRQAQRSDKSFENA